MTERSQKNSGCPTIPMTRQTAVFSTTAAGEESCFQQYTLSFSQKQQFS
nr:MAG TPA: hypothetical protein [Caudoviricetes sp.]